MSGKKISFIATIVGLIVTVITIVWLLSHIKRAVFMVIASVLLAYLIKPPVDFLCNYGLNVKNWRSKCNCKGLPRTLSIVIVYIVLFMIIICFFSFALPQINNEAIKFATNFPRHIAALEDNLQKINLYLQPAFPFDLEASFNQTISGFIRELGNTALNIAKQSFSIIGTIFSTLASIFIVPLLAFLFLRDVDIYKNYFLSIFPENWRKDLLSILNDIDEGLGGFIRGQILVSICIGTTIIIALSLWRIDYALLIGTIAGVLNIIPFAGPIIGSIPAVLLALTKSPFIALGVLSTFLLIHEVEKQLIAPSLVGHSVGMPTSVILIAIMIGGELFGVVGILIAVPMTITLRVILTYIHQKWAQTWPENNGA